MTALFEGLMKYFLYQGSRKYDLVFILYFHCISIHFVICLEKYFFSSPSYPRIKDISTREHKMNTKPRLSSVQCLSPAGLHRMSYWEWGQADNPKVLICVHGLTRVGRDFDDLALSLQSEYRILCPDVVGRGQSDWLSAPQYYQVPQYVSDMVTLIARANAKEVHWVGTSMGGLIGMGLAALPNNPITRLVLNDVGPVLKAVALARIAQYVGAPPKFTDFAQAEAYIRQISAQFNLSSDAQWRQFTEKVVKKEGEGYRLHYDPSISVPFASYDLSKDNTLWEIYDAIRCPTLVVRGERSDLLDVSTWEAMAQRGPRAQLVSIPQVGHAPMLMDEDQIRPVKQFLMGK